MKAKFIFLIILLISFMSNAQSIEKFSIDSGGASASSGGIQIMYTIGEVNVAERTSETVSLSEGFITSDLKVIIDPEIFLQGPLLNPATAGLMNDILREDGYLPTTSPYSDGASVIGSPFSVTGADAIVDWVWVELRPANDNTEVINGRSALLQRDGDIVDLDGVSDLKMTAGPTNYFVVVKHRNHLGVMSSATIGLNESTKTTVDFKDSGFSTFGTNARVQMSSGEMALWTGDVDTSGKAKFLGPENGPNVIKDFVLVDPSNAFNSAFFSSTGYLDIDLDLNGLGKFLGPGNDSNIIKDNVLAHPENVFVSPFFTINTTLPSED